MAYLPIRIGALRGDQKISFDAYVAVAEKHILYVRKGDSFEGTRLARLREKKIKKLYIRPEDEQSYRDYMARNIEIAYSSTTQTLENRTQIVQGLQQSAAEALFESPEDPEAYAAAKEGSARFVQFLNKEDKAIKGLLAIENVDQNLAHHGVTVASVAVEIAKRTGYKDDKNLPFLALGALMHDVGHYLSNQNIAHAVSEFSPDDLKIYQAHPLMGARRLKDLKHMDQHVIQIVLQHEENIDGSGYPEKLTENKLNPLSVFVQSANIFDRLVTFEKMSTAGAIKHLLLTYLGRYPLTHLNALKALTGQ